jgi:hypothetical protein
MDLDPVYCRVAIERWQNFTRSEAVLEATGQTFDEVMNARVRKRQPNVRQQEITGSSHPPPCSA